MNVWASNAPTLASHDKRSDCTGQHGQQQPCCVAQVIKDDVTKQLPPGAKRVAFSRVAPNLVKLKDFVRELPDDTPAVFVVGAMAHGKMDIAYVDQWVSVSEYPLSAACCIGRITNAFEDKWDIV